MNRYSNYSENRSIADVDFVDGLVFQELKYAGNYFIHEVQVPTDLSLLSYEYYNTPEYWWIIAWYNNIRDPYCIPPGTIIKIPEEYSTILEELNTDHAYAF